ncbi:hypothetical protein ACJMK2_030821, partial [Sinanodonta woodiana]
IPNFDNGFAIIKRVKKRLKRWKLLETEIPQKRRKTERGYHSKHLEPYKKERDELAEHVQKDISELQSIFNEDGGMPNEKSDSLRSAKSKINQLTIQLETERKSKEEALSSLQSAESEINRCTSRLEKERKSKEETLSRLEALTNQLENERKTNENVPVRPKAKNNELINQLENEKKANEDALVRLTIDKSDEERAKELKLKCDELETELARVLNAESAINQLKSELENKRKTKEEDLLMIDTWNIQLTTQVENERKAKEDAFLRINQLTTQVENERKAKEDALLRLSSMASHKLRDNNPNIADLSDPNRPTKLSEQFSELYDNEWTDAFDELETQLGDKEEKDIISYLRDFVLEIHSVCSDLSFSKLKTIEEAYVKPSVPSEDTKIPTEILKSIKDGIKSMAPNLLEKTREVVLSRLEEKYLHDPVAGCLQHTNVKRYIDKCTEVCWYMSVQDPQLVMDGSKSPDDKFDSNKHREYTKKGPYEDFVVWPALYLYKGGQMLSKGVAQGGKKEMTGQQ